MSKRSRRTTLSKNEEPSPLGAVLTSKLDVSVGTNNETPSSDLGYNKTGEKNSSESFGSMQSLEGIPIEDNTPSNFNPPQADESPKSLEKSPQTENPQTENPQTENPPEFKEEIMEGEDQSTDDESEHEYEPHDYEPQRTTIKQLSDTNFFESCQVDVPYQNQQQIPLYKVPIDFKFKSGKLHELELSEQEYKNARLSLPKEQRKKLTKKTPKIFYLRTFDRFEYDKIRKRMRKKISTEDLKCTSKTDIKRQLILFPECFLLVPISDKRQKMMVDEFDNSLFFEIIQHKKFPEEKDFDQAYLDQTFEPDKDQSWFKIDESQNFHPETGK